MSTDLRSALTEHLDTATPPRPDLEGVVRAGTRRRRVRRASVAAVATAAVVAATVGVGQLTERATESTMVPDYPAVGRLDFSEGLRAYADPGRQIHLGGRTFDAAELDYLDTDAVATPYGVVFYDAGRPMLLAESGEITALVEGPVDSGSGFHPTAKADSQRPLVAFATLREGTATLAVRDMASGKDVDSLDVDCGACEELVIDALDDGVVLYRTGEATMYWQVGDLAPVEFAGPETRVVDVRNHALLYSGPVPPPGPSDRYIMIEAPVDAQLTHDGRYVLDWSSRLRPTRSSDDPVVLEQGPRKRGALGFWTIDTDGSVLVATLTGRYPEYTVFDCKVPSGDCVEVGPLTPTGGDPQFIGNDM